MATPAPPRAPSKSKKTKKTAWQIHGGALFDSMSNAALQRLRDRLGLNTEENYVDMALTTTFTSTFASKTTTPAIAQGTGIGSRVGASIRLTRIELRVCIAPAPTQTASSVCRLIMTRNRETGTASAANTVQTTTDVSSPLNHQFTDLGLELLLDEAFPVGLAANGAVWFKRVITDRQMPDMHMIWPDSDSAGTSGALNEGAINLWGAVDAVNTASPIITGRLRLCYVDN